MRQKVQTYVIEGLSCINCAASKLNVEGTTTCEELELAGAFDKISVFSENQPVTSKK